VECLTQFKTVETIIFDSLPDYLREKYMGVDEMKRPKISEMVLGVISTLIDQQNEKGIKKYGQTLDGVVFDEDGNEYDWQCNGIRRNGRRYAIYD
jgi:hypothetical protein